MASASALYKKPWRRWTAAGLGGNTTGLYRIAHNQNKYRAIRGKEIVKKINS